MQMREQENWDADEAFDLRQYWNVIDRKKWAILGLAVAVGLLAALIAFAMTPISPLSGLDLFDFLIWATRSTQ